MAQVTSENSIAAPIRRDRSLKLGRPRPVRPRFKQRATAVQEAVLPPSIELQMDQHPYRGAFDAAGAALREGHPLATLVRLRQEAADEIERLLGFLDATDGDADTEALDEPTDAEIRKVGRTSSWRGDVDDEDGADEEPWLGRPENHSGQHQVVTVSGSDDDREEEDADDDTISEPTLGWIERDSQRLWPDAAGDFCDGSGELV